jgi:hypothetical protein
VPSFYYAGNLYFSLFGYGAKIFPPLHPTSVVQPP